jgi:Ca2+-binding EF-hand superfamily protein
VDVKPYEIFHAAAPAFPFGILTSVTIFHKSSFDCLTITNDMGLCFACEEDVYDHNVELRVQWKEKFQQMNLSVSHVNKLYKAFRTVDFNGDGLISIEQNAFRRLTDLYHQETCDIFRNFDLKIFSELSSVANGTITFPEFVLQIWNFCSISDGDLDMFTFRLYRDSEGAVSAGAMVRMLEDIYIDETYVCESATESIRANLEYSLQKTYGSFNFNEFQVFSSHVSFLRPVHILQTTMRRKFLGERFWKRITKKRAMHAAYFHKFQGRDTVPIQIQTIHSSMHAVEWFRMEGSSENVGLISGS